MGKRTSEFLQYWDYSVLAKDRDMAIKANNQQAYQVFSTRLYSLKNSIKSLYGLNETTFKFWLEANKEFLTVLTKEEKKNLKQLFKNFEVTDEIEDLALIYKALDEANYSAFIDEYMEDYAQ